MKFLLLSHCFIKDRVEISKVEIFNFVIDYFKSRYTELRVVVAGHGIDLVKSLIKSDYVIWLPFLQSEIGYGHPVCVEKGLQLIKELGGGRVLKMRLDTISSHDDIFRYCDGVLNDEKTSCIVTAQTNNAGLIGDLFMYGDIDFLLSLWNSTVWNYSGDGMVNINRLFHDKYNCKLREKFSYRENDKLKWILIKPEHFNTIKASNLETDYGPYLWDKYFGSYITENDFYRA